MSLSIHYHLIIKSEIVKMMLSGQGLIFGAVNGLRHFLNGKKALGKIGSMNVH